MSENVPHSSAHLEDYLTVFKNLPILSWNVHDSMTSKEGPKTDDKDFVDVLLQSSIFCLQETKRELFLPNYECFNSTRKDSRSGGTCIGIHHSLSGKVKQLKTGCTDFQAVTIFPQDDRKLTIINVYDSPEQSSYKAKRKVRGSWLNPQMTKLEQLMEFREQNPNMGEIMLVGDLNARTGNRSVAIEELEIDTDPEDFNTASYPGTTERASKDQILNACNKLKILNGCTLGDIFGEYTSVNYNGRSVVDYMAATPDLKEAVLYVRILELTKYSDHKPCICDLKCTNSMIDSSELLDSLEDAPTKYKWNNEDQGNHFKFLAAQNYPEFQTTITDISATHCNSKKDVLQLNSTRT